MRKINRILLVISLFLSLSFWTGSNSFAQGNNSPQIKITQVDNSHFPQVIVYVSVTNAAGEPVGVDPAAIQISENGQPMKPMSFTGGGQGGPGPLTTMMVMDVSGSMNSNGKLDGAKTAAKAYVDQMRPGDQAGLMTYNTHTKYVQPLSTDHGALVSAIDGITATGNTAMYDSLIAAEAALKDISGRKAILAVTDGLDNSSSNKADDVIKAIGQGGLSISTIGLGDPNSKLLNGLDEVGLKSLAEKAGGAYSFAGDPQSLTALFQLYGRTLQNEYAISYTSPATLRDGVNRNLTVALAGSAVAVQGKYNPGGVLPEVPTQSWMLFGGILLGLLILLFVPMLINLSPGGVGFGGKKKSRIKLTGGNANTSSRSPVPARGRVKIK